MRYLIQLILLLSAMGCQNTDHQPFAELRVIGNETMGYGYEIWEGGKCRIRQENLPAMPGNIRCPDKSCAEKIGQLALKKMQEGQFPPTLSYEDVLSQID